VGGRASHPLTSSLSWTMCEVLLVGFVTGVDREHDVDGARNTVGVTYVR